MSGNEGAGVRAQWPRQGLGEALAARLTGPGGYYNIGNALGLCMGLFLQLRLALGAGEPASGLAWATAEYLAGGWSAAALTLATIIFFASGEAYHRAWTGPTPDAAGIERGDLLSGLGAVALGISLFLLGDPALAATSGLLHAAGKFGSAFRLGASGATLLGLSVPQLMRVSVVVSRLPAMVAAALEIARVPGANEADLLQAVAMPATLLACYLLWARADLLLLRK